MFKKHGSDTIHDCVVRMSWVSDIHNDCLKMINQMSEDSFRLEMK